MPGFQNVRYRFYSDIDWFTDVLALHEHKTAHWFNKVCANLEDPDRRDIYSITKWEYAEYSASVTEMLFLY